MDNGTEFNLDVLVSEIEVWDNPQSPSYPALSFLSIANLIQPGTGGSPFDQPVMWYGRPLGSEAPSPNAIRTVDMTRISLGFTGTFDNGFDWDLRYTTSMEDAYFNQPDTGTTALNAAIANNTFDLFVPSNNSAAVIA